MASFIASERDAYSRLHADAEKQLAELNKMHESNANAADDLLHEAQERVQKLTCELAAAEKRAQEYRGTAHKYAVERNDAEHALYIHKQKPDRNLPYLAAGVFIGAVAAMLIATVTKLFG